MKDKIDNLVLNSRLSKLTLALDEALYQSKEETDMWHTLTAMKTILDEEYKEFKMHL